MIRWANTVAIGLVLALLAGGLGAQTAPAEPAQEDDVRFTAVDVFVDPRGEPLAAYQVEFLADPDSVTLVGIEGGEHPAFTEPPYYDPKALSGNRVVLAAFNTGSELPSARTRVATLHLRVIGDDQPAYSAKIEAAGNPQGKAISAEVTVGQGVK